MAARKTFEIFDRGDVLPDRVLGPPGQHQPLEVVVPELAEGDHLPKVSSNVHSPLRLHQTQPCVKAPCPTVTASVSSQVSWKRWLSELARRPQGSGIVLGGCARDDHVRKRRDRARLEPLAHPAGVPQGLHEVGAVEAELEPTELSDRPERLAIEPESPGIRKVHDRLGDEEDHATFGQEVVQLPEQTSMVLAVVERLEEQDHVETVPGRELQHVGGLERQSVGVEGAALRDQVDEGRIELDRRDVVPRLEERLRRVAPTWAELEDARWRWHRDRLQQESEEDQLIADHARSPRAIRERSPHAFREVEDRTFARRVVALPGE